MSNLITKRSPEPNGFFSFENFWKKTKMNIKKDTVITKNAYEKISCDFSLQKWR